MLPAVLNLLLVILKLTLTMTCQTKLWPNHAMLQSLRKPQLYNRFKVEENKINFVLKILKAFDCNMYDKKSNIICTLYEKIYTVKFSFYFVRNFA